MGSKKRRGEGERQKDPETTAVISYKQHPKTTRREPSVQIRNSGKNSGTTTSSLLKTIADHFLDLKKKRRSEDRGEEGGGREREGGGRREGGERIEEEWGGGGAAVVAQSFPPTKT